MVRIISHKFVRYNANSTGRNTGDCVCRALSLAYNMSYTATHTELVKRAGKGNRYNIRPVYEGFIEDHGVESIVLQADLLTLAEFCDTYGKSGTYLVLTNEDKDRKYASHIVCVIDGAVYDSWDSCKSYVKRYYIVNKSASTNTYDRSAEYIEKLSEYGKTYAEDLAQKYLSYFKAYNPIFEVSSTEDSSVIRLQCALTTSICDREVKFNFKIDMSIPLDASEEDAKALVDKTLKIRLYDRFAAIRPKLNNKVEEIQAEQAYSKSDHLFLDGRERRFVDTLPGWIRPLLTYVSITKDYWGGLRYQVRSKPLKGDPNSATCVDFEGNSADQIRREIEWYKKDYSRLYEDYSYDEVV